jgi:hypothetical protein
MTTLLAESTGQLSVVISDRRLAELAFRTAVEIVESGDHLIVIDRPAASIHPMTHSAEWARWIPRVTAASAHHARAECRRHGSDRHSPTGRSLRKVRHKQVLVPDLLGALYQPRISTRNAARILAGSKEAGAVARNGAQIVVLCRQRRGELGTKAHFQSSLCASADKVYFRNNT